MTVHVALLRGVNLAGKRKVSMADLRAFAVRQGLDEPQTLLQSGNLVFRSPRSTLQLERLLETAVERHLGLEASFFLRTAGEWHGIVAANPKPADARRDPGHFVLMLLKDAPAKKDVEALQSAITGRERVSVKGREAYILFPDGIGQSRLTTALIDAKLRTRCTGRNWNTVLKLGALVSSAP